MSSRLRLRLEARPSDQGRESLKACQDAPEGEGRSKGDGQDQTDPRPRA
ncbi:MAG: hypothetical protein Q7V15_01545 [Phenylobacterium sp.]|nr:hypothetical protein [Phenylobacterium sp.]MDO8900018.1 hypothetical protein [Phenylobacterium sp.]MDP2214557.1 hypothetical protein [Phenylobacterium sp.]